MKKIFRLINVGFMAAVILALGAVAGAAQNPCEDAAGMSAAGDAVRGGYANKTLDGRKKWLEPAKAFVEKYGACEAAKELADWTKTTIPKIEQWIKDEEARLAWEALLGRFNNALKTRNFDELYASGKEILAKKPDEFRDVEIALGFVGLEESAKTPRVTKYNDDTLKFARQAIADIEAGKTFKTWGVSIAGGYNGQFKNKEDALGWLNYAIGYILFYDKNQKKEALAYLYKASQSTSDVKNEAVIYQTIGDYFTDDVKKLADEVLKLEAQQTPELTDEARTALLEKIKATVAMVNGTSEAAIDAYARALDVANKNPKTPKAYKDSLLKSLQGLYNVRFGKMDGFDSFIANTIKKPLPNPLDPIKPISDPETVKTTSVVVPAPGAAAANGASATAPKPTATPIKP
jgi:hypothetical protein